MIRSERSLRRCVMSATAAYFFALSSSSAALTPGTAEFSVEQSGRTRWYVVHAPPRAPVESGWPVVLVFHGGGGNAKGQEEWCGLDAVADREGFLAVYPEGTGRWGRRLETWNAGGCCGYAMDHNVDDVGFVVAQLEDLARRTSVDRTRVYATGMSNGAMMAYRLAAEIPERIAAIAPVAGAMVWNGQAPLQPVPVLHFHSVDDPRALYAGGLGPPFPMTTRRVMHPPVEETIARWVKADGCAPTPTVGLTLHGALGGPDASHTATRYAWGPGVDGAEVVLWKLTGAGHVWPGAGKIRAQRFLGPPTRVVDASNEMWAFFRRFSRPKAPALGR